MIKEGGCVIWITDNSSVLILDYCWSRNLWNGRQRNPPLAKGTHHYDQEPSIQVQFTSHVKAMAAAFEESGSPFNEDSQDLVVLGSKEVMDGKAGELKQLDGLNMKSM